MNIETPQEDKIIVELSGEDMTELDITYEDMDYSKIETRRAIFTILDKARHALNRDIDPSGKMLIEVLPKPSGGCIICFTVLGKEVRPSGFHNMLKIRKDTPTVTYEFDSLKALTECAERIRKSYIDLRSSLYSLDGIYRLVVSSEDLPSAKNLLSEYAFVCRESPLFYEAMNEHWKLLADGNAIEMMTLGL